MFKNYVCWQLNLVNQVMDTEALQTEDHFFLATHHPMKVRTVDWRSMHQTLEVLDERELLARFLDSSVIHRHIAIIGPTGAGKSHLIRWLSNSIPRTSDRQVVLIPKVGTNLKSILDKILSVSQLDGVKEFRDRLDSATSDFTASVFRAELCNALAIAVGPDSTHAIEEVADREQRELRDFLVNYLPPLLYDAHFRETILRDGGVIDRLAEHIIGQAPHERLTARREFELEDLTPDNWNCSPARLGDQARHMYMTLKQDGGDFRQEVKAWINKNLDWAILRALRVGQEDLGALLKDIRIQLEKEGKELILLMEDFAKLQGIDRQLLEALLVRPDQSGERLCTLRSAMALTTGYFAAFAETTKDRIDIIVDTEVNAPNDRQRYGDDIGRFVARYLNAIRLDESRLRNWHIQTRDVSDYDEPLPNACAECQHDRTCLAAFGESDSIGLYPFNLECVHRMYNSLSNIDRQKSFNPRRVINDVIKNTLLKYTHDIEQSTFPPSALKKWFGIVPMSSINKDKVRELTSAVDCERYETLVELWGDPRSLTSVSPDIYGAFGLAPLQIRTTVDKDDDTETGKDVHEPTPKPDNRIRGHLDELDKWIAGGMLSQDLAQTLREHLYTHLNEQIDWDSELFAQSFYSHETTKCFRQTSLAFARQSTQIAKPPIQVMIPLNDDFVSTAVALQGMLLFHQHQRWDFEDSGRYLRAFQNLLGELSNSIVNQLYQPHSEDKRWEPVPAVVELLALGASMRGAVTPEESTIEGYVNSLFLQWDDKNAAMLEHRSNSWQDLMGSYYEYGPALVDILKSRTMLAKGGRIDTRMIDPTQVIGPLKTITGGWQPKAIVPDRVRRDYEPILKLRKRVDRLLTEALKEERAIYIDWHDSITASFGAHIDTESIADSIHRVCNAANSLGLLPTGVSMQADIKPAIAGFRQLDLMDAVQGLKHLESARSVNHCLPIIGNRSFLRSLIASADFLTLVNGVLKGIENRIEHETEEFGETGSVADLKDSIAQSLKMIVQITRAIAEAET